MSDVYPYKISPWLSSTIEYAMKFRDLHRLPDSERITVAVSPWVFDFVDSTDLNTLDDYGIDLVARDD